MVDVEKFKISNRLKRKLGDKEYREAFVEDFYTDIREFSKQYRTVVDLMQAYVKEKQLRHGGGFTQERFADMVKYLEDST